MKHFFVFITFCSLLFLPHCQLEKIPPVLKTFKKIVVVDDQNTFLTGVYQRSKLDTNYYVAFTLPGAESATTLLDEYGKQIGSHTVYSTVIGGVQKAFPDGDDGYFLIGGKLSQSGMDYTSFFAHLPSSTTPPAYQPLIMLSPGFPEFSVVKDAILTSKGKIMVCGEYHFENTDSDIGITGLDGNGVVGNDFPQVFQKYSFGGTGIVEKTDGEFMMTANCKNYPFPPTSCGSNVIRFSENYGPQWSRSWIDWPQPYLDGITKAGGNLYTIYNSSGYMAIIDEDFNLKKETTTPYGIKRIITTSDNNLLVLGNANNTIYLTKYSAADLSVVLWSESYTEPTGTISAVTVSETLDKGFIIGGNFTKDAKTDIYVIKTDETGKVYD